jgi:3-methyladenine DNA glycosylase AlkD
MLQKLTLELNAIANPDYAQKAKSYFKTLPGQYAAGDKFIGVRNPELRKLSKKYSNLQPIEVESLIHSLIHEKRLLGLLILIEQYKKADLDRKEKFYTTYVNNFKHINNWDLVDLSAPNIVGDFLFDKKRDILTAWAISEHLWTRRIAIISTYYFIRNQQFEDTIKLAKILLNDKEDLIHKAVGWMLREVGKRNSSCMEKFLVLNYRSMPRTMLRYAIEKLPESKRQQYLKGII